MTEDPLAPRFVIAVEHDNITRIGVDTRAEALDVYLHPFARPDVPDIFSRTGSSDLSASRPLLADAA